MKQKNSGCKTIQRTQNKTYCYGTDTNKCTQNITIMVPTNAHRYTKISLYTQLSSLHVSVSHVAIFRDIKYKGKPHCPEIQCGLPYNPQHDTFSLMVTCKLQLLRTPSNQYQHIRIALTHIYVLFKVLDHTIVIIPLHWF